MRVNYVCSANGFSQQCHDTAVSLIVEHGNAYLTTSAEYKFCLVQRKTAEITILQLINKTQIMTPTYFPIYHAYLPVGFVVWFVHDFSCQNAKFLVFWSNKLLCPVPMVKYVIPFSTTRDTGVVCSAHSNNKYTCDAQLKHYHQNILGIFRDVPVGKSGISSWESERCLSQAMVRNSGNGQNLLGI